MRLPILILFLLLFSLKAAYAQKAVCLIWGKPISEVTKADFQRELLATDPKIPIKRFIRFADSNFQVVFFMVTTYARDSSVREVEGPFIASPMLFCGTSFPASSKTGQTARENYLPERVVRSMRKALLHPGLVFVEGLKVENKTTGKLLNFSLIKFDFAK